MDSLAWAAASPGILPLLPFPSDWRLPTILPDDASVDGNLYFLLFFVHTNSRCLLSRYNYIQGVKLLGAYLYEVAQLKD